MNGADLVSLIESRLARKGVLKKDFYSACNVSPAMFSNWRRGLNMPSAETLKRINDYLGTDFGIAAQASLDTEREQTIERLSHLRDRGHALMEGR